jgi:hypothetical protein
MTHFICIVLLGVTLSVTQSVPAADAMVVTQLDLTGGSVDFGGRFHHKLDRLFEQPGLLVMNEYQPAPDIVPPITKHRRTFSLFTSGVRGDAAPAATVSGSTITVDLSSLFFGVSRGNQLRAWNIGGLATGVFNPETLEFSISWEHLVGNRPFLRPIVFSLQGQAVLSEVPLPGGMVLFVTGLLVIAALCCWRSAPKRKALPSW